jgi:hypothetical protein
LFDIPKNLLYISFERFIIGEHPLSRFPSQYVDLPTIVFMSYKIVNVSLNPVESYSPEVADRIDYLGHFGPEQVLVEKDIDIY